MSQTIVEQRNTCDSSTIEDVSQDASNQDAVCKSLEATPDAMVQANETLLTPFADTPNRTSSHASKSEPSEFDWMKNYA